MLNLGFKVLRKHATKKGNHNGVIVPEAQQKIEAAAAEYYKQHGRRGITTSQARTRAYTTFWGQWRECK